MGAGFDPSSYRVCKSGRPRPKYMYKKLLNAKPSPVHVPLFTVGWERKAGLLEQPRRTQFDLHFCGFFCTDRDLNLGCGIGLALVCAS
jgi:hypothetical protein